MISAAQVFDKVDSTAPPLVLVDKKIEEDIEYVKQLLSSMDEGRVSLSPYDTAWIALIRDLDGRDSPQFPSCLEWIAKHQLADGSWGGDEDYECPYDRILNTLACVVALRTWNVHDKQSEKGISYIKKNVCKLEDANAELITASFELMFPALLDRAQTLGIREIPYDAATVKQIYSTRDSTLKMIPKEEMHKEATYLLFRLEGLENLEWEKLLKLQSPDASFLSPASTAFALMETKDENCFKYIKYIVEKFDGGAPSIYPVDLWARLWAVDKQERLGISRFFELEIKDCLKHIYTFWTEKGIFTTRNTGMSDIDDTAMGFRLLRLHGYDMDPNVFKTFQKDNKFNGQGDLNDSPSAAYNLYRASQIQFVGEEILEDAKNFSYKFLHDRLTSNQLLDKWVVTKNLPDEIRIGLELPWYASLPRVEARYYLQHYGASSEVWIGKVRFRIEESGNDKYLELARLDFNRCQAQHQTEWIYMKEWYESSYVQEFGISRKDLLLAYFLAAATIFEPERKKERIMWSKSQIVSRMITSFFSKETTSLEQKTALIDGFKDTSNTKRGLVDILLTTLHQTLGEFNKHISHQLKNAWGVWLKKLQQGDADGGADAELLTTTLNICAGHIALKNDILSQNEYKTLSNLTKKICQQLIQVKNKKVLESKDSNASIKDEKIEQDLKALTKLVLDDSVGINRNIKQTFLSVAKTYYYGACIAADAIDVHIFKVLFEPVV